MIMKTILIKIDSFSYRRRKPVNRRSENFGLKKLKISDSMTALKLCVFSCGSETKCACITRLEIKLEETW